MKDIGVSLPYKYELRSFFIWLLDLCVFFDDMNTYIFGVNAKNAHMKSWRKKATKKKEMNFAKDWEGIPFKNIFHCTEFFFIFSIFRYFVSDVNTFML